MNEEYICASQAQRTDKISVTHIDDDGTSELLLLTAAHMQTVYLLRARVARFDFDSVELKSRVGKINLRCVGRMFCC